jgi:hypothetical protein
MTAYTKSTNFATKDTLTSGDPLKIVKGTEINTEFDNIATAVNSKTDTASPTFTGTVTIPTLAYAGTTLTSAVTGTGKMVLDASPTLVTPILGTPTSGNLVNCTGFNYNGFKNRIINGGMDIAQRGTSFTSTSSANNDDTYVLDRFYILSDGNDAIDVTQTTTVPTGAKYSIGLDVETANKKFGIAQIIENANCFDAIGGNVTLSFQAKVSSTTKLDNVKCAIVAWSGTADTVTSDIISAWGAEGTNPTLIANATYENSPANLNVTTSFATYSVTANVDTASTSNIIVFIWSDVTDTTAGDFLYITNVQLEKGSTATSFDYRPYGTELALCQRYFFKTYDQGVNPATVTTAGNRVEQLVSTNIRVITVLPVSMRAIPTVVFYAPGTGATGNATDNSIGNIAVVINSAGTGSYIALNNGGGTATRIITSHSTADAEL